MCGAVGTGPRSFIVQLIFFRGSIIEGLSLQSNEIKKTESILNIKWQVGFSHIVEKGVVLRLKVLIFPLEP